MLHVPPRPKEKSFRMPCLDLSLLDVSSKVFSSSGQEVSSSCLHTPSPALASAKSSQLSCTISSEARLSDNVGLNVKGLDKDSMAHKGHVMVYKNDDSIGRAKRIDATIQILTISNAVNLNYTPTGFLHTSSASLNLVEIVGTMNTDTGNKWAEGFKKLNTFAEVVFEPQRPFTCNYFEGCEGLSPLATGHGCAALGKIMKVE